MYYKDLEVWKEAIQLVTDIYTVTKMFPQHEMYGLVSQLRRCAVSAPSNIAEGTVKHSDRETLRFLDMALGSLAELDTQLIISKNLGYIANVDELDSRLAKTRDLLVGLIKFYQKQLDETDLVP